jgi:hypothetical protein
MNFSEQRDGLKGTVKLIRYVGTFRNNWRLNMASVLIKFHELRQHIFKISRGRIGVIGLGELCKFLGEATKMRLGMDGPCLKNSSGMAVDGIGGKWSSKT